MIAVVSLAATQAMNLLFVWHLKHAGLALAIALGACVNAGLLLYRLRRDGIYVPCPGWAGFLFRVVLAVYAMAAVLWSVGGVDTAWLIASASARIVRLVWLVVVGVVTYFGVLWLLGFRLRDFARRD